MSLNLKPINHRKNLTRKSVHQSVKHLGIRGGIPESKGKPTTLRSFCDTQTAVKSRLVSCRKDDGVLVDSKSSSDLGRLKDECNTDLEEEPSSSSMVFNFLDPRTVYVFMLKGFSTLTTNGSGVLASFIPFDPSSSGYNFAEWTSLSSLFTEFRLRTFECQFVGSSDTTVALSISPVAISSNMGITGVAPTNIGGVIQNADGIFWKGSDDTTALGYTHVVKPSYPLGWSLVSSPTTTPYAGAPGCIQIYATNQGISTTVGLVRVMGVYEFRVRS
jgi:hypothetical protein